MTTWTISHERPFPPRPYEPKRIPNENTQSRSRSHSCSSTQGQIHVTSKNVMGRVLITHREAMFNGSQLFLSPDKIMGNIQNQSVGGWCAPEINSWNAVNKGPRHPNVMRGHLSLFNRPKSATHIIQLEVLWGLAPESHVHIRGLKACLMRQSDVTFAVLVFRFRT